MPCKPFRSADGKVFGFVCSRGTKVLPCSVCGAPSSKLCDGPPSPNIKSKDGTCSAPLCVHCAVHVDPDRDYCPKHAPESEAFRKGREAYKAGKHFSIDNPYDAEGDRAEYIKGWVTQRHGR